MSKLARMRIALAAPGVVAVLAGCAGPLPPEREERDRVILAAIEPCRQRYSDFVYTYGVTQNGGVNFWYYDHMTAKVPEVQRCLAEAHKDLKVGPWLPGRLAAAGPANVPISSSGQEIVVPVRLNGVLGAMAVRGNSEFTLVTPAYAKRAGLQIVAGSPTTPFRVGDQIIAIPYAKARALEVGDASVEALNIAVYDSPPGYSASDGVLGKSFLSQFKMNIDRQKGRLTLEPLRTP